MVGWGRGRGRGCGCWGFVAEEEEEGEGDGEVGEELRVRGRHAIALAVHFCTIRKVNLLCQRKGIACARNRVVNGRRRRKKSHFVRWMDRQMDRTYVRFGLSALINRLSRKLSASQPIWPANMKRISTSREDQIRVT